MFFKNSFCGSEGVSLESEEPDGKKHQNWYAETLVEIKGYLQ